MNDDFEKMSSQNNSKSAEIRSSINRKSEQNKLSKDERSKHFESIRNKQQSE
jgi:hypothetical protein